MQKQAGERYVLGKATFTVQKTRFCAVGTLVVPPFAAVVASHAADGAFAGNQIALLEVVDLGPDFDNLSGPFVARGDRHTGHPGCEVDHDPVIDFEVGTAKCGGLDSNQNIVRPNLRNRQLFESDVSWAVVSNGFHHSSGRRYSGKH